MLPTSLPLPTPSSTYKPLSRLHKQHQQSFRLANLINRQINPLIRKDLFHLSLILEENIQQTIDIHKLHNPLALEKALPLSQYQYLLDFYTLPKLPIKSVKYSSESLYFQLTKKDNSSPPPNDNQFSILLFDMPDTDMDIESTVNIPPSQSIKHPSVETTPKPVWNNDTSVTEVSGEIFTHLLNKQQTAKEAGELDMDAPSYGKPDIALSPPKQLSQWVRFNLICHRGTISDIPALKTFKSFMTTLCNADPSLIILPYQVSKQHYSSLTNIKQIQTIDEPKLYQFLRPYYQKQMYSLSGYLHISSTLSFNELTSIPSIVEWLDTYNYFIKLCPSQTEEMTQIDALCYSKVFIYREDLKSAILSHPLWTSKIPKTHLSLTYL